MVLSSIYLCWQLGEKFSRFQGWHGEWQIFETRSSKAKHPGRLTAGSPKNHWKLKSGKSSSTKLPSVWVPAVHFCGFFSQKLLLFCLWGREIVGCVFFFTQPKRGVADLLCFMCFSRWWFQILFIFTPTWGDDPIWLEFSLPPWDEAECEATPCWLRHLWYTESDKMLEDRRGSPGRADCRASDWH